MIDLVSFLRARLDEDAVPNWDLVPYSCPPGCCAPEGFVGHHCGFCDTTEYGGTVEAITQIAEDHDERIHQRSRWLAEVESKRRIIDMMEPLLDIHLMMFGGESTPIHPEALDTLRLLAQPYADRPDFNPEWLA